MKSKMLRIFRSSLAAVLMVGAPVLAHASVVYSFTDTAVGPFGAGPYGTVTLDETGSDVAFTILLRSDMNFVNTDQHSIFSFNSIDVATGDIKNILFNGHPDSNVTVVDPGENAGYGRTFSLMLDCTGTDCANGAPGQHADPLTFTVANATYSDFGFKSSGTKAFFASDVICVTGGCDGKTGAIGVLNAGVVTGGGGGSTGVPVPEPVSVSLFGLGLLGLAAMRRRRG